MWNERREKKIGMWKLYCNAYVLNYQNGAQLRKTKDFNTIRQIIFILNSLTIVLFALIFFAPNIIAFEYSWHLFEMEFPQIYSRKYRREIEKT